MKKVLRKVATITDSEGRIRNPSELNIPLETIKILELRVANTRDKRRKIARKYNISWELYKVMEDEINRRYTEGLNLENGNPIISENKEKAM